MSVLSASQLTKYNHANNDMEDFIEVLIGDRIICTCCGYGSIDRRLGRIDDGIFHVCEGIEAQIWLQYPMNEMI